MRKLCNHDVKNFVDRNSCPHSFFPSSSTEILPTYCISLLCTLHDMKMNRTNAYTPLEVTSTPIQIPPFVLLKQKNNVHTKTTNHMSRGCYTTKFFHDIRYSRLDLHCATPCHHWQMSTTPSNTCYTLVATMSKDRQPVSHVQSRLSTETRPACCMSRSCTLHYMEMNCTNTYTPLGVNNTSAPIQISHFVLLWKKKNNVHTKTTNHISPGCYTTEFFHDIRYSRLDLHSAMPCHHWQMSTTPSNTHYTLVAAMSKGGQAVSHVHLGWFFCS